MSFVAENLRQRHDGIPVIVCDKDQERASFCPHSGVALLRLLLF
jgi:hypothetical protein